MKKKIGIDQGIGFVEIFIDGGGEDGVGGGDCHETVEQNARMRSDELRTKIRKGIDLGGGEGF